MDSLRQPFGHATHPPDPSASRLSHHTSPSDLRTSKNVFCTARPCQADGRLSGLVLCWERPLPPLPIPSKKLKTERAFYVSDKCFGTHFEFWNHILPDLPSTNHPASPIWARYVSWQHSWGMSAVSERLMLWRSLLGPRPGFAVN